MSLHYGLSRISHTDTAGFGEIASLTFSLDPSITGIAKFWITDITAIDKNENPVPVDGQLSYFNIMTGIGQPELQQEINVYPNPTNGLITIADNRINGAACEITLSDISGKEIGSFRHIQRGNLTINLQDYPKGFCFLRARTESGIYTTKIILR